MLSKLRTRTRKVKRNFAVGWPADVSFNNECLRLADSDLTEWNLSLTLGGMNSVISDEQTKKNVAANLTRLLSETGVSRRTVATKTGESHTAIADYAKGVKMPGAGPLARLAEFFKVSTDFLLSSPKKSSKKTA